MARPDRAPTARPAPCCAIAPSARPAPFCAIAPPDLLARVAAQGSADERDAALRTIAASASMRTRRAVVGTVIRQMGVDIHDLAFVAPPAGERRTVYDAQHGGSSSLPGRKVRGEGDLPSSDESVNEAYDGADKTYDLYHDVYERDSLDGKGMELISSVHYGVGFDNAFWNGGQMVYGDGDATLFDRFTKCIDVIGHELTHGVTQFTAGLEYSKQSGAINEHISDVFGSLVKQYKLQQTADQADWLIGEGTLVASLGQALRSMKAPGTAWKFDDQPAKMSDYVDLPDDNDPQHDNGGVHINSGIPNHAFFLAATAIGGYAWEKAGKVWYRALTEKLQPDSQFTDLAQATVELADDPAVREAIESAWAAVEVEVGARV
jgi:Zn-dependent metalloprotease